MESRTEDSNREINTLNNLIQIKDLPTAKVTERSEPDLTENADSSVSNLNEMNE